MFYFSLERYSFLSSLGYAIGNSLWQMAILWLTYITLCSIIKLKACDKYKFSTILSFVGFVWFIYTIASGYKNEFNTTNITEQPVSGYLNTHAFSTYQKILFVYNSIITSLKSLSPYISSAYLIIFMLLAIRLINGFKQISYLTTEGLQPINDEYKSFVQHYSHVLKIKQPVYIYASKHIQSPLTMGFWKPIILLPIGSINHLTTEQIEAILLHELAHIRRYDYLINIFLQIVEVCLFFNPFMRLLLKSVKQERENSCDDFVIKFQYNAKDYVKALLVLEQNSNALLALGARNSSFQLLHRVKRLVAPQAELFNYRQQVFLLLIFTILTLGFTSIVIPKKGIRSTRLSAPYFQKSSSMKNKQVISITNLPQHNLPAIKANPSYNLIKEIEHIKADFDNEIISDEVAEFETAVSEKINSSLAINKKQFTPGQLFELPKKNDFNAAINVNTSILESYNKFELSKNLYDLLNKISLAFHTISNGDHLQIPIPNYRHNNDLENNGKIKVLKAEQEKQNKSLAIISEQVNKAMKSKLNAVKKLQSAAIKLENTAIGMQNGYSYTLEADNTIGNEENTNKEKTDMANKEKQLQAYGWSSIEPFADLSYNKWSAKSEDFATAQTIDLSNIADNIESKYLKSLPKIYIQKRKYKKNNAEENVIIISIN